MGQGLVQTEEKGDWRRRQGWTQRGRNSDMSRVVREGFLEGTKQG